VTQEENHSANRGKVRTNAEGNNPVLESLWDRSRTVRYSCMR
jgi:hypothetical protein